MTQIELYGNISITPDTIHGVKVTSWAYKTTTGDRRHKHVCRTASTDYDSSELLTAEESPAGAYNIWEQNPNTTSAWTESEVNGAEVLVSLLD